MDFDQCACSGKSLVRLLRPAIMACLARGAAHGYQLAQNLRAMRMFAAQEPDHTGIYRALKEMEAEGLLESSWELADAGPAKRRYELTTHGKRCLKRWQLTVQDYMEALKDLLAEISKAAAEV